MQSKRPASAKFAAKIELPENHRWATIPLMTLSTGSILNDRYRIDGMLGRGGMGAVYLAFDLTLQMEIAVKENLNVDPVAERQFRREASLLATLRHPNLPRVTNHFILEGQQYLVMDYIAGEDLDARCTHQPPTVTEVLSWSEMICDALIYLHSLQPPVIHRDIKPANIKLQPDGNVVLVDFGIAKVFDQTQTTTGARGLTPGFSPPEQYGGSHTDHRSDQYALGASLYSMLTGQRPTDCIERLFNKKPLTTLRSLNPAVPANTEAAIHKALSLDPDDRFPDLVHFKAALRGEAQPETIRSAPPMAHPTTAPRKSFPIWIPISGLAGLVGVLGIGGFFIARGLGLFDASAAKPKATLPVVAELPSDTPTAVFSPTATLAPSHTPSHTPVPSPTPTETLIPTPTPLPVGGGGLIAFASNRADTRFMQIWTMKPDGTDPVQLTFGPGNQTQPRWSPDGKRIAYVSDADGNKEIYIINADGRHAVNLTNNPYDDYEPAWSPDGLTLAFTSTRYVGQTQIYLIDVYCPSLDQDCSASEPRWLSRGWADEAFANWAPIGAPSPSWMPQGQPLAVAISINKAPYRLFFRSEQHGNPPVKFDLQDEFLGFHDLRWSPDGRYIIGSFRKTGSYEIVVFPIADRARKHNQLTNTLGNIEPAISPDGLYVVFTSTRTQNFEIFRMSITGADQVNLSNSFSKDMNPDWQPPPRD